MINHGRFEDKARSAIDVLRSGFSGCLDVGAGGARCIGAINGGRNRRHENNARTDAIINSHNFNAI
ncbi:MAG: hypothetical protein OEW82_06290 [Dehalococcoidia bacterium]|nr:hypothetical protein [Dehalococcoidia bacterium]